MDIYWICRINEANSGEHSIKHSDLKLSFPDNKGRLYISTDKSKNKILQGTNDKKFKQVKICSDCNNNRLSPYDETWRAFSTKCKDSYHIVNINKLIKSLTEDELLNIHLFFLIKFGCFVKEVK